MPTSLSLLMSMAPVVLSVCNYDIRSRYYPVELYSTGMQSALSPRKWQQETAIFFPLRGALTRERKHQQRKQEVEVTVFICGFQLYKESLHLVNAYCYSNETVARQLHSHRNCYPPVLRRASFSSFAFWMRVCALRCTNLMEQLPIAMLAARSTANYSPPNTHRSA